jgi:GMP synthase-like glutamine amidotransferase
MSVVIILQQVEYLGPGRIVPVLRDYGIPLEVRHLYKGDEVPTDLDEVRAVIVLDAPTSVKDLGNQSDKPYLAKQLETITRMMTHNRKVLGIGFGAQLLAHAAGAKVYPNAKPGAKPEDPVTPMPEFGWGPVNFPFPGGTEPIVTGLMDGAPMFHCHVDTFDLPKLPPPANPAPPPAPPPPTGNALLSSSKLCKNQAFRFKTRLFGFQYHFEFTREDIEKVLENEKDLFEKALGFAAVDQVRRETEQNYIRYERLGNKILKNWVQFMHLY